jgi:hypothetical protein
MSETFGAKALIPDRILEPYRQKEKERVATECARHLLEYALANKENGFFVRAYDSEIRDWGGEGVYYTIEVMVFSVARPEWVQSFVIPKYEDKSFSMLSQSAGDELRNRVGKWFVKLLGGKK